MNITAIYCIKNTVNGKVYPGSAVNVEGRWREHKRDLKNNNHHSNHLQKAWLKYGEENFEFLIVEECLKKELLIREQVQLDAVRILNPDGTLGEIDHNLAYNTCPIAGSQLGMKRSEETKKKMSEIHTGSHHSEETKKKISEAQMGRTFSEETKKKISEAVSGEKNSMYNKHHSEETRKRLSEALSGEKHPNVKLTWEKVQEIRRRYEEEAISQQKLANEYGVTRSCIKNIVTNCSWKEEIE